MIIDMKRVILSSVVILSALLALPFGADARRPARRRAGARRAGTGAAASRQHRHLHAHHRASRRREQRAAGDAEPRPGLSHRAGDRDPRQRRAERDRPRDLRGARRAADRRARGAAPLRRRGAVLHARGRLRLLLRHRRDVREVGARGDHRRLRAADPHDSAGRHHHAAADRQRRRTASHGVGGDHPRRLQARRRSDQVPGADQGRSAAVAAEEALSQRRLRVPRRTGGRRQGDARQLRRLRPAARQDLQRDRHRGAQHAQVPGHGAAAVAAGAGRQRQLPARRDDDAGAAAERRDVAVRRRRQQRARAWRGSPAHARRRISPKG